MRIHFNRYVALATLVLLAACDGSGGPYVYKAKKENERPATINSVAKIYAPQPKLKKGKKPLPVSEREELMSVTLQKIGDRYVGIGKGSVAGDKDSRFQISPGKQDVLVSVSVPHASTDVGLNIRAQPGETYTLGGSADPKKGRYLVWVQNSKRQMVDDATITVESRGYRK